MFKAVVKYGGQILKDKVDFNIHSWTYSPGENPKRIVIIGGSYGGYCTGKRLANSLPSGYIVTIIEKYPHHNHTFVFPRYSVYSGNEEKAFVPLKERNTKVAPEGALEYIFDECIGIQEDDKTVLLSDGETKIPYEYLVIATGTKKTIPSDLGNETSEEGINKLKELQQTIVNAENIAVVGAGAVGVELATDIKYKYGETKKVVLYNSRDRILPRFPEVVHEKAIVEVERLGVEVKYNRRPNVESLEGEYDAVFSCVGVKPSTKPFIESLGDSVNPQTGGLQVNSKLQLPKHPDIFALGDVIDMEDTPKMAIACFVQSITVGHNINLLIQGKENEDELETYTPGDIEGSLQLTLGLNKKLFHLATTTKLRSHKEDFILDADKVWWFFDVPYHFK